MIMFEFNFYNIFNKNTHFLPITSKIHSDNIIRIGGLLQNIYNYSIDSFNMNK